MHAQHAKHGEITHSVAICMKVAAQIAINRFFANPTGSQPNLPSSPLIRQSYTSLSLLRDA